MFLIFRYFTLPAVVARGPQGALGDQQLRPRTSTKETSTSSVATPAKSQSHAEQHSLGCIPPGEGAQQGKSSQAEGGGEGLSLFKWNAQNEM